MIEVSIGELLDKLSILEIKSQKIKDSDKLIHVNKEKKYLLSMITDEMIQNKYYQYLLQTNQDLWDIEDKIREFELDKNFKDEFIQLARSVYRENDKRFYYKNKLNNIFETNFKEVKSYSNYLPVVYIDPNVNPKKIEEIRILLEENKVIYKGLPLDELDKYPNIEYIK